MSTANLDALKEAYRRWHDSKGKCQDAWLGLFAETLHFQTMGGEGKGLAFAQERKSRQEVLGYFKALEADWEMQHWTAHTYVTEGDRIAVFGDCAWKNKATRKVVATPTAHLWEFRNGKAISVLELFDSAKVVAAATD